MESAGQISEVLFSDELSKKYLSYALSTLMSRSLPDVRDGLKPVHRRLLYVMHQLKLSPENNFKKSARVVGDVIGKFHPHGDVAIYEALVRLAQDFSVRYRLIDGQGNFGSIDGDNAAAMRYTEAKLTLVSSFLLEDLDKKTVEFRPTYDAMDEEPAVLPANFPNLLANGAEGIAVGMATSIPPHNAEELCEGLRALINKPDITSAELTEFIKGPDFPTGGKIIATEKDIADAYEKGRGSFRVRATWQKEDIGHGQYQIIVTQIPYQTVKSRIIEKIDELIENKKLPLLASIRDESAEDIRIVIEPKSRSVDAEMLMESLFKLSELENKYNMNINVVDKDLIPRSMNLKDILQAFLEHRDSVIENRSKYLLEKNLARSEIIKGYLIVYLNLDRVIEIIRNSDEPKEELQKEFKLTDIQAEAILNMKLRSLRKLEEMELKRELEQLLTEQKELENLLASKEARVRVVLSDLDRIQNAFGKLTELGARRSEIIYDQKSVEIKIDAFVEKEPLTIICSEQNWIRAIKGHNIDRDSIKYKDGDKEKYILQTQSTNTIIFFTRSGKFFSLPASNINKGKSMGDAINLVLEIDEDDKIIEMLEYQKGEKFILATKFGKGFIVSADDVLAQTKSGKIVMNLVDGDEANILRKFSAEDTHVAVIGTNRKLLIFPITELPIMKRGQGVALQKYKEAHLSDLTTINQAHGLSWRYGNGVREEKNIDFWIGKRASAGKLPPHGFSRMNRF